jgi:hypothetical protein
LEAGQLIDSIAQPIGTSAFSLVPSSNQRLSIAAPEAIGKSNGNTSNKVLGSDQDQTEIHFAIVPRIRNLLTRKTPKAKESPTLTDL